MTAISALVHRIPLLSGLSDAHVAAVETIIERQVYAAGDQIVRRGAPATAAYYLIDGNVAYMTEVEGEQAATLIPAGSTLLELAMIVEMDVQATCVARGPAKVLVVPRESLLALMQADPSLTDAIIEQLTGRLLETAQLMRGSAAPFSELLTA